MKSLKLFCSVALGFTMLLMTGCKLDQPESPSHPITSSSPPSPIPSPMAGANPTATPALAASASPTADGGLSGASPSPDSSSSPSPTVNPSPTPMPNAIPSPSSSPSPVILNPPAQWQSHGIGGGGALYSPSFSPFNADEIYLACDMGELFHTTNRGQNWTTLDFRQIQGWHNVQVQFTSDPNVRYSLSADGNSYYPVKSTDGGATWKRITDPTNQSVLWLAANLQSATQVLLGSPSGLYVSNDAGISFNKVYSDAGASTHFAGALFDGINIYVGTSAGLLVSNDGGNTFSIASVGGIPAGQTIVSFTGAKQNGVTRFIAVALRTSFVHPDTQGSANFAFQGVYTLDYGQPNWVQSQGFTDQDQPFFAAMSPGNTSVGYVAGATKENPKVVAVYRTSDGGVTWQSVFKNGNNAWSNLNIVTGWQGYQAGQGVNWWLSGAPALGFAVAPNDSNRILVSDSAWAHLSTDGGATWQQVYLDPSTENRSGAVTPAGKAYKGIGLEPTATWWITWMDSTHMIATQSDFLAMRSADSGDSWAFDMTGLVPGGKTIVSYQTLSNPTLGTLYAATSTLDDIYQSTELGDGTIDNAGGNIMSSSDGGANWVVLHDFGHPVVWMEIDPQNPNRMVASVPHSTLGGVFVTNDLQDGANATWVKLSVPPRTQGHPFNVHILNDGTLVVTYSGRVDASNKFTDSSGVFTSVDNGNTWIDLTVPGLHYWTMNLTIDPHDPSQNTWYVGAFSGWGGVGNGGLYRTADRGKTFTKIFNQDTFATTVDPANPDGMYATSGQHGLWYTGNLTNGSPKFNQLNFPFFRPSRVFFNPNSPSEVWVTTFGNGLYKGIQQ